MLMCVVIDQTRKTLYYLSFDGMNNKRDFNTKKKTPSVSLSVHYKYIDARRNLFLWYYRASTVFVISRPYVLQFVVVFFSLSAQIHLFFLFHTPEIGAYRWPFFRFLPKSNWQNDILHGPTTAQKTYYTNIISIVKYNYREPVRAFVVLFPFSDIRTSPVSHPLRV